MKPVELPIAPRDVGQPRHLHTLQQIAAAWGTSRAYIYALVVRGELRASVLPSMKQKRRGRILVDPTDLAAFVESRKMAVQS
jgi:hypothetical protein